METMNLVLVVQASREFFEGLTIPTYAEIHGELLIVTLIAMVVFYLWVLHSGELFGD